MTEGDGGPAGRFLLKFMVHPDYPALMKRCFRHILDEAAAGVANDPFASRWIQWFIDEVSEEAFGNAFSAVATALQRAQVDVIRGWIPLRYLDGVADLSEETAGRAYLDAFQKLAEARYKSYVETMVEVGLACGCTYPNKRKRNLGGMLRTLEEWFSQRWPSYADLVYPDVAFLRNANAHAVVEYDFTTREFLIKDSPEGRQPREERWRLENIQSAWERLTAVCLPGQGFQAAAQFLVLACVEHAGLFEKLERDIAEARPRIERFLAGEDVGRMFTKATRK